MIVWIFSVSPNIINKMLGKFLLGRKDFSLSKTSCVQTCHSSSWLAVVRRDGEGHSQAFSPVSSLIYYTITLLWKPFWKNASCSVTRSETWWLSQLYDISIFSKQLHMNIFPKEAVPEAAGKWSCPNNGKKHQQLWRLKLPHLDFMDTLFTAISFKGTEQSLLYGHELPTQGAKELCTQ